jgi:uncharacterized repeat protein (TIGR02543 family)
MIGTSELRRYRADAHGTYELAEIDENEIDGDSEEIPEGYLAVDFDLGYEGADYTHYKRRIVQEEGLVTAPQTPMRSGWEFLGWFASRTGTKPYNFSTPIESNLTLYARWAEFRSITNDQETTRDAVEALFKYISSDTGTGSRQYYLNYSNGDNSLYFELEYDEKNSLTDMVIEYRVSLPAGGSSVSAPVLDFEQERITDVKNLRVTKVWNRIYFTKEDEYGITVSNNRLIVKDTAESPIFNPDTQYIKYVPENEEKGYYPPGFIMVEDESLEAILAYLDEGGYTGVEIQQ